MSNLEHFDSVPSLKKEVGTDSFNDRLLKLAEKFDSQASFAAACGVSVSGIQRLLAGGMPRLPILVSIAKGNNVSIEWLATGEGIPYLSENLKQGNDCVIYDNAGNQIDLDEFTFIPRYDVSASAGHGSCINQESYMFSISYRTYWLKNHLKVNPKALIALTAKGDSMLGVIDDRDVIIVDTENKSLSDGIFVLRLDGNLLVKRAQSLPNHIIKISSANPVYEPFQIDMKNPPEDFEVIGSVVHTEPGTLFKNRKYINIV